MTTAIIKRPKAHIPLPILAIKADKFGTWAPQCGQVLTVEPICPLHSGHVVNAMISPHYFRLWRLRTYTTIAWACLLGKLNFFCNSVEMISTF